jgi:hypothetical protein
MKNNNVSPSFLKQEAKKLKKEKGISHSEALNEAAKLHGFSGYKHYLNELESHRRNEDPISKEGIFERILQEKNDAKKLDLAVSYVHFGKMPFPELFKVLSQFKSEKDIHYLCIQSTLPGEVRRSLLNYFLESKEDVQLLPGREHFVAKNVIVEDLKYSLLANELIIVGDYTIEFAFEHEIDEQIKDLPHFRREPMFGDFCMSFKMDGKIDIENPSICEDDEDGFFMTPFKSGDPAKLRKMREEIIKGN